MVERAARDLGHQLAAARARRLDLASAVEHARRVRRVVQQRRDQHRPAALGGDRLRDRGSRSSLPLVSMKTPRPLSPMRADQRAQLARRRRGARASACRSRRCAARWSRWRSRPRRPPSPRARAPASRAISSVGRGALAWRPRRARRCAREEWPTKEATLGPTPLLLEHVEILGKLSKPQWMPARSASSDMPSTCVRLRIVRSRSARPARRDGEAAIADHRPWSRRAPARDRRTGPR